jgi:predicted transcriptional regulator
MKTQNFKKENKEINIVENSDNSIDLAAILRQQKATLIRMELIRKKIPQRRIAEAINVTDGAVSQYIDGKSKSKNFSEWVKHNLDIAI